MNLLLIGHSVADILQHKGEKVIRPGGLFYSASTLKELALANDKITLCTQLDDKYFSMFENVYSCFDLSMTETVDSIPVVELIISGDYERQEHYKNISGCLSVNYSLLDNFDGILVNMITGFDIDLDTLRNIRKSAKAPVYMDVHTLSRGLDEKMHREFRRIPDFNQWAENLDIIQCNEHEIFSLSDQKDEIEIVKEIFNSGVSIIVNTKASRGARIYYRSGSEVASFYRSPQKISNNNKVGLGDVFGSAFFYGYISTGNIFKAAEIASLSAEFIASINNLSEFANLKENVL